MGLASAGVIVLIPAFNEQDCIAAIIGEVRNAAPTAEILVINDASTDATSGLAASAAVGVLDLADNQGALAAMRAGYRFAADQGFDIAVRIDADGQHKVASAGTPATRSDSADDGRPAACRPRSPG